mgnify:CR=1 FL=1
MDRDESEGRGNPASPETDKDNARARLIGELVQEIVSGLGPDKAIMPDGFVTLPLPAGDASRGVRGGPRGDHAATSAEGPTMYLGGSGIVCPSFGLQMWRQ